MRTKLFSVGLILLTLNACREKTSVHKNAPFNQKIDALLKEAAATKDDNRKAALLGDASELLIAKGDFRQALLVAKQGEKANPTQKQCLVSIAEAELAHGKIEEARIKLEETLSRNPNYGRALFVRGNLEASLSNLNGAITNYAAAQKVGFTDSRLALNQGAILMRAKKTNEALAAYERAVREYPDRAEAYLGAGIASSKLKKKDKAKAYFTKVLELQPNGPSASRVRLWIKDL